MNETLRTGWSKVCLAEQPHEWYVTELFDDIENPDRVMTKTLKDKELDAVN